MSTYMTLYMYNVMTLLDISLDSNLVPGHNARAIPPDAPRSLDMYALSLVSLQCHVLGTVGCFIERAGGGKLGLLNNG